MSDDVEAIKKLKARYFRLIDTKGWDELVSLFTDDAVIDMTGAGGPVADGGEAFSAFLQEALGDVITIHHGHMPEIDLTSLTTATGIWALEDYLWWPEGSPMRTMHGFGHYHEAYEKTGGDWRIKALAITRLHVLVE